MLKGRGREPRSNQVPPPHLAKLFSRPPPPQPRAPLARPEPDYEVVDFPTDQYVNAKFQPSPPPPPPRPALGQPEAGPCGLCGGGGARVRCAECGPRALCASCDDMYHRHPKRRNHRRQPLTSAQIRDIRPPLPPKVTTPVPPPRRNKIDRMSASPLPPMSPLEQRRATLATIVQPQPMPYTQHIPAQQMMHTHTQFKGTPQNASGHLGSMPYLPKKTQQTGVPVAQTHVQANTMADLTGSLGRNRGSLHGYNVQSNMLQQQMPIESWENTQMSGHPGQVWGRPLRRGTSVMELSGETMACPGCAQCVRPAGWRYGSCASLEHSQWIAAPWGTPTPCCPSPHGIPMYPHPHVVQTPQPYRRADSRMVSRTASRTGSRAASPAMSVRSRTSRRTKHRTPSPPSLPSSDADSESESEPPPPKPTNKSGQKRLPNKSSEKIEIHSEKKHDKPEDDDETENFGPAPPPPDTMWQCEHCTFVNESGVRVCAVCCKTPTTVPKVVDNDISNGVAKMNVIDKKSPSPVPSVVTKVKKQNEKQKKEKISTGCGPSPPRNEVPVITKKVTTRLVTPSRESSVVPETNTSNDKKTITRQSMGTNPSPPRETVTVRVSSPYIDRNIQQTTKHSVSVGPSPPKEDLSTLTPRTSYEIQRQLRDKLTTRITTGTSPPPQNISTQTYEDPSTLERPSSVARSRSRRRFRDEGMRERSHSRHSLSSDTRESDRSIRTTGGRWEWREGRDSSPAGDWSENERRREQSRLTRRASHLDLRRTKSTRRPHNYYGSEAPSPEPTSIGRTVSLEALAGADARREAERGLELARLMTEAERLGFTANEVHAALAQNPLAPLSWLRERWTSLCAGVQAAAERLAPGANITQNEARTALSRHRGAMWPAVTECVEKHRRQTEVVSFGPEGRVDGRVWGSPVGADDEALPPLSFSHHSHRTRAERSSDEYEISPPKDVRRSWENTQPDLQSNSNININPQTTHENKIDTNEIAYQLKSLLLKAGVPIIDEKLLLRGLMIDQSISPANVEQKSAHLKTDNTAALNDATDLGTTEDDFINAYNELTRLSPLPKESPTKLVSSQELKYINNKNEDSSIMKVTKRNENTTPLKNSHKIKMKQSTTSKNTSSKNNSHQTHRDQLPLTNRKKVTRQISSDDDSDYQDDKTKDLSDIVDSTQKLIQKMKDEINSDINTFESDNASSENESSVSNDSEVSTDRESSFSESADQTNTSSDNNSSPEDVQEENNAIQRTSSEENEQFEEAMDHLDNQMEDFKQTNIKMLDSIAKSLLEEHSITLQVTKPQTSVVAKKSQDINNNYFKEVETFEEIYEQLNSTPNINQSSAANASAVHSNVNIKKAKQGVMNITKQIVNIINIEPIQPTRLIYTTNNYQVQHAIIEQVPDPPKETTNSDEITEYNAQLMENSDLYTDERVNTVSELKEDVISVNGNAFIETSPELINNVAVKTETEENIRANSVITINNPDPKNQSARTISPVTQSVQDKTIYKQNNGNIELDLRNHDDLNTTVKDQEPNLKKKPKESTTAEKFYSIKSGIPKLIKILQNNKQKTDKGPKVIASKVPIRRPSLKQHPAPAPPKAHFGNIQNGQVKNLQNRLFNKPDPTAVTIPPTNVENKPSTSTLNKKKAPSPPTSSPAIAVENTEEDKKPFFRETCRTEDEWSDSDSDEPLHIFKTSDEPEPSPPPPPPPITLRRVSGQLIDLARVELPEGSPERQARMLLAEGASETWEQAQLAVELISRGINPTAALLAAHECADLSTAMAYLEQDCELCASRFPEHEMVSMLRCTHRCCSECARHYFTVQVTERSIADCVCPYCKEPELENLTDDSWLEYFSHLDILLKSLLEPNTHELFQRKLRDRTLARDPNFRWCVDCSSGFFVHPKHKKHRCPECRSVSCASCRKPWRPSHEGLTCEQYAVWLEDNDPERSMVAVQQHLKENGLECPRCHFKYSLSRGGCMHFTCTQCKYEFCYGCAKPFKMGAQCGLSEYCAKLGLHAHHPRNCLFYLRDKEPVELQTLLQMNNVTFESKAAEGTGNRCPIQLQRETPAGLVDSVCGADVAQNQAGLCKLHYVEYLAGMARGLDPIPIMDVSELVAELRRRALPLPERGPWDTDPVYAGMCAEIVRDKIPLD